MKLSFMAIAIALLPLVACESERPASSQPAAPTKAAAPAQGFAVRPSLLTTAIIADPKTFNPIIATDTASSSAFGDLFDPLLRMNPKTLEMEPMLAERWEHNPSRTEWTFHLRKEVRWHDGKPFTANDVVFTFDAIYDEHVPNSHKYILTISGQRIRVEAVDPHTVRFRLPRTFSPFLHTISDLGIIPEHVLGEALRNGTFAQQWGVATPPENLIGTGPYRMLKYVPAQYVQYRRNADYWLRDEEGRPLPYIEERTLLITPNQDTTYLKFLSGETHIHRCRPEEVPDLHSRSATLDIAVKEIGLDTGSLFVVFNRNPSSYEKSGKRDARHRWFTNKLFLRALAHAMDKQAMISNCLYGFGKPAVGYISPENRLFHHPDLQDYAYDLNRARALLNQAGFEDRNGDGLIEDRDGTTVEFTLNTNSGNQLREKLCSIIKEDWGKLGIKVNYRPIDFTLLVEKLDTTFDWDAILIGFTGGIEPHNAANLLLSSGNLHLWHPNQRQPATPWEAEIDRLVEEGSREIDLEKRKAIYRRVQEILHEELPMIETVRQLQHTAHRTFVKNFDETPWGVYRPERIAIAQ